MTVSEKSFEECLTAVRACREIANPNFGFRLQLKQYEGRQSERGEKQSHVCVCERVCVRERVCVCVCCISGVRRGNVC